MKVYYSGEIWKTSLARIKNVKEIENNILANRKERT